MPDDFIPDSEFVPDAPAQEAQGAPAPTQPNTPAPDFIPDSQFQSDEDKYGGVGQTIAAGAEGLGRGLLGPIAPAIERMAGVPGQDIVGREQQHPIAKYGMEALGLGLPAIATAGASLFGAARKRLPEFKHWEI